MNDIDGKIWESKSMIEHRNTQKVYQIMITIGFKKLADSQIHDRSNAITPNMWITALKMRSFLKRLTGKCDSHDIFKRDRKDKLY
jgi:hypothetical protein